MQANAWAAATGMRQLVANEVDATTLPTGCEDLRDCGLDALVGVEEDQLEAA